MNAYWFNVITTLGLVAALPGASATKICYNSFGTLVCRDRMPVHARIGIWVAFLLLLVLIIVGIVFWQRRRASRQRDAIATVEANQINGPPPTPFESGFAQVQGLPVSCPPPAYHSYGPRTGAAPKSAYSIGFTTPRTANMPKRPQLQRDSYSTASQYSITPEDDKPRTSLPPPVAIRGFRGPGLPVNPRPAGKYSPAVERRAGVVPTPRDKNTRFVIPDLPDAQKKDRREWQVRLEALRSAPIKKSGFEMLTVPVSDAIASVMISDVKPALNRQHQHSRDQRELLGRYLVNLGHYLQEQDVRKSLIEQSLLALVSKESQGQLECETEISVKSQGIGTAISGRLRTSSSPSTSMPSLFSRSRANSTPKKSSTFLSPSEYVSSFLPDEFGRVSSRSSSHDVANTSPSSLSKKDKKKATKDRPQTIGNFKSYPPDPARPSTTTPTPHYADGAFLPLSLELPRNRETGETRPKLLDYGFLSYERHIILAPEQLSRLVDVVTEELSTRGGITAPFIFSTTALDVSYSSVKRLIRAFLDTCDMRSSPSVAKAEIKWRDEARFAGMYELGMCLRWGLARPVRISKGQEVRGLIPWDIYLKFRESEAAKRYPPGHFQTFLDDLSPTIQAITNKVLIFLIRLTANSTSSGHTPPTLSPLFGPLFFGLGPASLAFHHVYLHYLRTANAMEHIILAFIRWQDTPRTGPSGGAHAALGVPARLKDWIKRYPASLPFLNDPKKDTTPQPRKGARTVRVLNVRRNVRLYSVDLVRTAATWGSRATPRPSAGPSNALYLSKEWERVAPSTLKLPPKYSEAFKKRMNMPPNFHPDCGSGYETLSVTSASSTSSSYMSSVSSASSATSGPSEKFGSLTLSPREGEDRFRSLTDKKWGDFESMGFGGIGEGDKKLEFDLTEGARQEQNKKRQTLSWNDFSAAGFSRTDTPLSTTLQLSGPVLHTVASWPSQKVEISKKLKKVEKSLPHFGWDTEPVVFNEEVVEEAFLDVFCDLIYGGGWMDGERYEEVDRDSNWAVVDFKSTPPGTTTTSGTTDPRIATMAVLFEEFVPIEYRQMLSQSSTTKRRLPSLFASKSKQWKPAATLNGRPYEVGHVPRSPSYREVEFEGLLQAENSTKVISATPKPRGVSMISTATTPPATPQSAHFNVPPVPPLPTKYSVESAIPPVPPVPAIPAKFIEPAPQAAPAIDNKSSTFDPLMTPAAAKRMSRFRLPATVPIPSPSSRRKSMVPPAQYSIVEFETRLASYSDDEYKDANETESVKQQRRQSKDDAWVDILVGDRTRMLGDQDAKRKSLRGAHSDPDIASMEVAQVLAAVKNRSPSPPSMMERVDRDYGLDQHVQGLEIDEIEAAPRTSDVTRSSAYSDRRESGDVEGEDDEQPVVAGGANDGLKDAVTKAKMKARQGRPGYFDIHPERRHQLQTVDIEDEIRAKLARDDSDEEEEAEHETHPTAMAAELASVPIPQISLTPAPQVQTTDGQHISSSDSKLPQSRTAALIEMYRERERGGATSPVPPPVTPKPTVPQVVSIPPAPVVAPASRIPVRPLPSPTELAPQTPAGAVPPPGMDGVIPEDADWPGPLRYEHGAPLHNVIEEEEEEEQYN